MNLMSCFAIQFLKITEKWSTGYHNFLRIYSCLDKLIILVLTIFLKLLSYVFKTTCAVLVVLKTKSKFLGKWVLRPNRVA